MQSTEITVVKQGQPVVAIDMNNLNYDLAEKWLSTQGGTRAFAGEQLGFNGQDGVFKIGYGNGAQEVDDLTLIVNVPYVANAWQDWSGTAPVYPYISLPFAGQALPRRDTLGNTDQSLWADAKFTKKGETPKKVDPWKEVLVMVARTESGRLFHLIANNTTSRNSVLALIRDAVVEGKRHPGKLPVVAFTAKKIKSDDGNFYVMETKITGWVKAEAQDNPGASLMVSTDEAPATHTDDEGEAKTVAKPRTAKPAAAPKPSRMADKVDDTDDEDEVAPAPVKRRTLQ